MTEQDKKIKALLKGNFDEITPSPDFTKNIMDSIVASEVLTEQKKFEYVPVISMSQWMLIGLAFLTVVYLGLTGDKGSIFTMSDYVPSFQFDSSIVHSQLALFAVLSIFTLLFVDRLLARYRLG
ncbi:MAG: hypothetical protein ACI9AT_000236 [Ulvibacter sp.]|jgi:hypothetical protein